MQKLEVKDRSSRDLLTSLPSLTSVRFLAAFWVLLNHYRDEIAALVPGLYEFLNQGASGVSLFFVLSGFILTHVYWDRSLAGQGRRTYFVHRIARIYPMYILSIVIVLPRLVLYGDDPLVRFAFDHPWLVGLSHLTLTHNWFFHPSAVFNGPTWSVACEAGFYLLFPSLLLYVRRFSLRGAILSIAVLLIVGAILPMMYAKGTFPGLAERLGTEYPFNVDQRLNQAIRMWPILRLPEFLIGMLVAVIVRVKPMWRPGEWALLAGLLIASAILFITVAEQTTIGLALVVQQVSPVPFFALSILALALARGVRPGFLAAPGLVLLGDASYALYLLHVPLKHAYRLLGERFGLYMEGPGAILGSLLMTIGISLAVFWYIESPLRRFVIARYAPRNLDARARA